MNRKYRAAKKIIDRKYNEELYQLLVEHKVCVRCRDDSRPLVSKTMCQGCIDGMRAYQRDYWKTRVENGTATRGASSKRR